MATEAKTDESSKFSGKRILVVEDEYFLADETRRQLQKLGAVVVGPTGHVDEALLLIAGEAVDAAILDVHLDGELVFPVAERLEELGIPYVFASGYDPSIIPARFTGFVLSEKPIDLEHIARALFSPARRDI
jgi:CheY-like chemotaxis protein